MGNDKIAAVELLKKSDKAVKQIKKMHQHLFAPKREGIKRPHKVLVSLSDDDINRVNLIKGEKESVASHVYTYYKVGINSLENK